MSDKRQCMDERNIGRSQSRAPVMIINAQVSYEAFTYASFENLQTGHNMRTKEMTLIVNILNVIYLSEILCCDFDYAIMLCALQ